MQICQSGTCSCNEAYTKVNILFYEYIEIAPVKFSFIATLATKYANPVHLSASAIT